MKRQCIVSIELIVFPHKYQPARQRDLLQLVYLSHWTVQVETWIN
uniref:Uncharacterized protein n=1 Tax=Arundo donax TaxID=35708 RepID=A0A0A9BYE3_ARUDO